MQVIEQIGYYDDPAQTTPAHNPCASAPCCVCGEVNGEGPLTWVSVLAGKMARCYFYAHHIECKGSPKIAEFEARVMDEVFAWEDAS